MSLSLFLRRRSKLRSRRDASAVSRAESLTGATRVETVAGRRTSSDKVTDRNGAIVGTTIAAMKYVAQRRDSHARRTSANSPGRFTEEGPKAQTFPSSGDPRHARSCDLRQSPT